MHMFACFPTSFHPMPSPHDWINAVHYLSLSTTPPLHPTCRPYSVVLLQSVYRLQTRPRCTMTSSSQSLHPSNRPLPHRLWLPSRESRIMNSSLTRAPTPVHFPASRLNQTTQSADMPGTPLSHSPPPPQLTIPHPPSTPAHHPLCSQHHQPHQPTPAPKG
jgi:hypothetical protein